MLLWFTVILILEIAAWACVWVIIAVWNGIVREKLQIKGYKARMYASGILLMLINVWIMSSLFYRNFAMKYGL